MSGICTILRAIFASALFSSNSCKPLPSRCTPFLHAKGASELARIIVQIPLMEFQNLHIITLVFFIFIIISFFLGMGYLIFGFFSIVFRSEMPLIYRIATKFLLMPALWIYSRFSSKEDREADKQDIAGVKDPLAKYHARIDPILAKDREERDNEPPP
jgi:hypothetical protein